MRANLHWSSCNAHLLPGALATRPRAVLPITDCSVARYPCGQSLRQLGSLFYENTPRIALQCGGMWQLFLCLVELPLENYANKFHFTKVLQANFSSFCSSFSLGLSRGFVITEICTQSRVADELLRTLFVLRCDEIGPSIAGWVWL